MKICASTVLIEVSNTNLIVFFRRNFTNKTVFWQRMEQMMNGMIFKKFSLCYKIQD